MNNNLHLLHVKRWCYAERCFLVAPVRRLTRPFVPLFTAAVTHYCLSDCWFLLGWNWITFTLLASRIEPNRTRERLAADQQVREFREHNADGALSFSSTVHPTPRHGNGSVFAAR